MMKTSYPCHTVEGKNKLVNTISQENQENTFEKAQLLGLNKTDGTKTADTVTLLLEFEVPVSPGFDEPSEEKLKQLHTDLAKGKTFSIKRTLDLNLSK